MGKNDSPLLPYQQAFIDFLITSGSLTFGEHLTKSGRNTPYFVNTGTFASGAALATLGKFYAAHIVSKGLAGVDVIFGPAYKGVPLAVTTAIALTLYHSRSPGVAFNRKETKDHGEKGSLIGCKIKDGDRVLIVEDVLTAGTTLREVVPYLRGLADIEIAGVLIAVDRCERGQGTCSAVRETQKELDLEVFPIVTIHDIVSHLSRDNLSGTVLSSDIQEQIAAYLEQYGAVQ